MSSGNDALKVQSLVTDRAITPAKLLSKICFAKYGVGLESKSSELKADFYKYLRRMPGKPITYQTINHWFTKRSVPLRNSALIFLQSYVINEVGQGNAGTNKEKSDSTDADKKKADEQKKVRNQLLAYLKPDLDVNSSSALEREVAGRSSASKDLSVFMSSSGRVNIDLGLRNAEMRDDVQDTIVGVYHLFRFRMSYSGTKKIAREVAQIFRRGKELRFRQWYLDDDDELAKFEGVAVVIGSSLWLFGAGGRDKNRFRAIEFRHINSASRKYRHLKWGLMLTDMPSAISHDPVAARVVLLRLYGEEIGNIDDLVRTDVAHLSEDEIDAKYKTVLMRMIENFTTASSLPNSTVEATSPEGKKIRDVVLRVNQETLESAISELFSD